MDKKNFNAVTDSDGIASLKISKNIGTYSVKATFKGDNKYNSVSKTFKLVVPMITSILIGNDKLLTNGYLTISTAKTLIYTMPDHICIISGLASCQFQLPNVRLVQFVLKTVQLKH